LKKRREATSSASTRKKETKRKKKGEVRNRGKEKGFCPPLKKG